MLRAIFIQQDLSNCTVLSSAIFVPPTVIVEGFYYAKEEYMMDEQIFNMFLKGGGYAFLFVWCTSQQ